MNLLALDTSTLVASVAVARGEADSGAPEIVASADDAVDTTSDILLPLIDRVLGEAGLAIADIDAVAVGAGPGSFTGLRIGMSTAKGLAFSIDAPLWPVSSLAALAQAAVDAGGVPEGALIVPLLDARRNEVFAGFYAVQSGVVASLGAERVLPPSALSAAIGEISDAPEQSVFCGDGAAAYRDAIASEGEILGDAPATPPARTIAHLALATPRTDGLDAGAPKYVRKSEAEIKFPHGNTGGTFSQRE